MRIPPPSSSDVMQWPRNYRSKRPDYDEIPKWCEQKCKCGC